MRKDLHIGLAIGGVLLAVLVVWGMVVNHSHKRSQVTLDKNMPGSTNGTEVPPPTDGGTTPVAPSTDSGATSITPPTNTDNSATPATQTPPAAGNAVTPTPTATPGTTAVAASGEKKNVDWDLLLNHNGSIPALGATTTTDTPSADGGSKPTAGSPASKPPTGASPSNPKPITANIDPALPTTDTPTGPVTGAQPTNTAEKHLKTHTVVSGETFSSISRAIYGSPRYCDQIAQANPKIDPNRLRPGTVLNLPDPADIKGSAKSSKTTTSTDATKHKATETTAGPSQAGIDPQKEYRIAAGDSLYKISVRLYGTGEEVDHLYDLNKEAIGPDRARLKVGMVIKIPAPATVASAH